MELCSTSKCVMYEYVHKYLSVTQPHSALPLKLKRTVFSAPFSSKGIVCIMLQLKQYENCSERQKKFMNKIVYMLFITCRV